MNGTRLNAFLVMLVLSLIGFGPLSLTCLIGIYVVVDRPAWFYRVVQDVYRGRAIDPPGHPDAQTNPGVRALGTRIRCLLSLFVLLIVDILPVPVTGFIGLLVVMLRPAWFKRLVERVYGNHRG